MALAMHIISLSLSQWLAPASIPLLNDIVPLWHWPCASSCCCRTCWYAPVSPHCFHLHHIGWHPTHPPARSMSSHRLAPAPVPPVSSLSMMMLYCHGTEHAQQLVIIIVVTATHVPSLGKVMGMGTHRGLWVWVQVGVGVGTGFGYPHPYPYPHGGYSGANSPF